MMTSRFVQKSIVAVLVILSLCFVFPSQVRATTADPKLLEKTQPDGARITLRIRGDEYFHWLEDENGYTVIQDKASNKYMYAELDDQQAFKATNLEVGKDNPQAAGLKKTILPSREIRMQKRLESQENLKKIREAISKKNAVAAPNAFPFEIAEPTDVDGEIGDMQAMGGPAPTIRKNLVLLVAFNDHYDSRDEVDTVYPEFGLPPSAYEYMFNGMGGDPITNPTKSVREYFRINSYNQVIVENTIVGWIKLPEDESFYANGNYAWMALHALERADVMVDFLDYADFSGFLDSLVIIHSGYAGEHDGNPARIWSHSGPLPDWQDGDGLPDIWTSNEGIIAWGYCTGPALWGAQPEDPINPDLVEISHFGVICHEMGHHTFGLPDLYDTDGSSQGVGNWCLMGGGSWGFGGDQLDPSHMNAWSKVDCGWVNPITINPQDQDPNQDTWGIYDINQSMTDPGAVYRINFNYENLTVRTGAVPVELAEAIEAGFPQLLSPSYSGAPEAVGVFRGGLIAGLPFESGVILCTGNAAEAAGPNWDDIYPILESPGGNTTTDFGLAGDSDLAKALFEAGITHHVNPESPPDTHDAAIIEFTTNFIPHPTDMYINFVFASEEYDDFGKINDYFAIFVDGVHMPTPLSPIGPSDPNSPNDPNNPGTPIDPNDSIDPNDPNFFNPVTSPTKNIEYDTVSKCFTAHIDLTTIDPDNPFDPTIPRTWKLVIADVYNGNAPNPFDLDSAVFIQIETFGSMDLSGTPSESNQEYLLIENRQPIGYEQNIPQGGLAIWHIDERIGLLHDALGVSPNNFEGYPGQLDGFTNGLAWPYNNEHYTVALLQADGNYDLEYGHIVDDIRTVNRGDAGDLYHGNDVDYISELTVPNTDTYKWGVIAPTHISISDISPSSESMCFVYRERALYNDDYDRPLPVECGQFRLNDTWIDSGGCGWRYSQFGFDCTDPDSGPPVIPVEADGFRIIGTTVAALDTLVPDRSDPKRVKFASQCAGFDAYNEPIDPIDVWHTFTPQVSDFYTFSLCSSIFDTTIDIFADPNDIVNGISSIACNDDAEYTDEGCLFQSRVTVNLVAGQTYLIRIGGYNGEQGEYALTIELLADVVNDDCENAVALVNAVPIEGSNYGATATFVNNDPNAFVTPGEGLDDRIDTWYSYTPSKDGNVTITVESIQETLDTTLGVYEACDDLSSYLVFNNDWEQDIANVCDSCKSTDSKLSMYMEKNKSYLIRVAGMSEVSSISGSSGGPSTYEDTLSEAELALIEYHCQDSPPTPPYGVFWSSVMDMFNTTAMPVMIDGVPTSTWTYGCTATSAGMIFGYYDMHGYPDMYTGSANGGEAPLIDLGQGINTPIPGACSIIATQNGFDGRMTNGHVDDYWISYGSAGLDPWENNWNEHEWESCTADYMGTNQWKWDYDLNGQKDSNIDGATTYFYNLDASKLYDFIPSSVYGYPQTEACHGLRLFAQSRGYKVAENYTQRIDSVVPGGFSFADYMTEIDNGYPVMLHVVGHTMVGVGYDAASEMVYLHDTWDNTVHTMPWGGNYQGMDHVAVSIIHLLLPFDDSPYGDYVITIVEAPENDDCENAIFISDYDVTGEDVTDSTVTATAIPFTPLTSSCGGGNDILDVWYAYRPEVDDEVTVSLCGSEFDTTLTIYDGCDGQELASGCNDDACGFMSQQSEITIPMLAGHVYYIRIAGYDGVSGLYTLKVMGGQGNTLAIDRPWQYSWYEGNPVNVCLSADGGAPPYTNWLATSIIDVYNIMDSSLYTETGTAQEWYGDDEFFPVGGYSLPFSFPFYGVNYDNVKISTNGFLELAAGSPDPINSMNKLINNVRIAPMWDDLFTQFEGGNPMGDIYIAINTSVDPNQIQFRWDCWSYSGSQCEFAVTLYMDGKIRFDYGPGNEGLTPTVGISSGNGVDYVVVHEYDSANDAINLGGVESVLFVPPFQIPTFLPPGVDFNTSGCFVGSPSLVGDYPVYIWVTDSSTPPKTIRQYYDLKVLMPGDVNQDSIVNLEDVGQLSNKWMKTGCVSPQWCELSDVNVDGTVDLLDLVKIAENWLEGESIN